MEVKKTTKYYKDENLLKHIGSRMREERIKNNISQETLANECEVDYSQVNRMELGKVNFSISNLFRIASALHVDPKHLLP